MPRSTDAAAPHAGPTDHADLPEAHADARAHPASFPFPTFRAGQREALEQAREAFEAGKRFVVVEAPTGAGKSAIAVALAREARSAYVLTNQKILQDQYVNDFPDLALMKGRSNYDCLVAPTHAAAAPCIAGKRFPACEECPYFTAKGVAMAANKHAGIRCALCWKVEIAELARQHNNANVLALPSRFISQDEAKAMVDAFLNTSFEGGRHERRIHKIPHSEC